MPRTLFKPIIHLNGTSAKALYAQYDEALYYIDETINTLKKCEPNSRDYYPYDDNLFTFNAAMIQHNDRMKFLEGIKEDISNLMEHCSKFIKD